MNKRYIFIVIFICLIITCGVLFFFHKKNLDANVNSITYDEEKYDDDFNDYEELAVDLDKVDELYTVSKGGVYHFTGTLKGYVSINTSDKVKIILDNVLITNENGPCIYVDDAKMLYIELVGESTLTDGGEYTNFDDEVNGAIYSKDDLILFGSGTLNVNANYQDGIVSKDDLVIKSGTYIIKSADDGIRGKDSVTILDGTFQIDASGDGIKTSNETDTTKGNILIQGGNFTITSVNDAVEAKNSIQIDTGTFHLVTGGGAQVTSTSNNWGNWGGNSKSTDTASAKGLKANGSILIHDIILDASTSDDTIHSNSVIEINGGSYTISSGDDGIHADSTITINQGTIDIKQSYEGIEANVITINDGDISVVASDDGINIGGGNDSSAENRPGSNTYASTADSNLKLTINGGNVYVNATGDGLDSNGYISMTGGNVIVDGPTSDGDGALDYDGAFDLTGGTLIAAGSSGMMQNLTSSAQGAILIYFTNSQSAGTTVTIGNDITYTSSKQFSCILVSSPSLKVGDSYQVKINGEVYQEFTLTNTISTLGTGSRNGMGGNPRGGRR